MAIKKDFWKRVEEQATDRSKAVQQARFARAKRDQQWACIDRLLRRAGYGTSWSPILPRTIGPRYSGDLKVDNDHWSVWIRRLALAWKKHIGLDALRESSMPSANLGFEVASTIFLEAAEGASSRQVAEHLRRARKSLGPWNRHSSSLKDSELALALFFRTLPELFINKRWMTAEKLPPAVAKDAPSSGSSVFVDDRPRSLGDASEWWATSRAFMILIGKGSDRQLRVEIKRLLPPPLGRKQGSEGYWQLSTLIQAAERVLSRHEGRPALLSKRDLGPEWKRYLKPPNFHHATPTA